jgi:hypothetical protein
MFTSEDGLDQPEGILNYLAEPLRAVRDAFDDGASYAETILAGQPRDRYVWAHLARYRAYHYLANLKASTWDLATHLSNSGIQISRGPLVLRALKRLDDGPPNPGPSLARRTFYGQQALPLQWGNIVTPDSGANLIVDWNVDRHFEVTLALSKPTGVWKYKGKPKLAWRRFVTFDDDDYPGFVPSDEPLDFGPTYDPSELDDDTDEAG